LGFNRDLVAAHRHFYLFRFHLWQARLHQIVAVRLIQRRRGQRIAVFRDRLQWLGKRLIQQFLNRLAQRRQRLARLPANHRFHIPSVPITQGEQREACLLADFMQEICQEEFPLKWSLFTLGYGLPAGVATAVAGGIFVATLTLIMLRPKQLNEALAALAGGLAMIAAGIVSPLQAIQPLLGICNIFLFFLRMLALSGLAERTGFFDWLAARAALLAKGSTRRLYLNVFLLGALISAFFSNDATAL